ncbi:hypothetical protein BH20ACT14_BH20ACT14_00640 [soil metagenome]
MCANAELPPFRLSRVPKSLVHMTSGPESPTRAALGFLVAKAAVEEGHEVVLFLAGDSVQLLRDSVLWISTTSPSSSRCRTSSCNSLSRATAC